MAGLPFLDTNLFLRHLTQDNAELSPKGTACGGALPRAKRASNWPTPSSLRRSSPSSVSTKSAGPTFATVCSRC